MSVRELVGFFSSIPSSAKNMRGALGLAMLIVVLGIFLPRVLAATESFLLTILDRATVVVQTIEPSESAVVVTSFR